MALLLPSQRFPFGYSPPIDRTRDLSRGLLCARVGSSTGRASPSPYGLAAGAHLETEIPPLGLLTTYTIVTLAVRANSSGAAHAFRHRLLNNTNNTILTLGTNASQASRQIASASPGGSLSTSTTYLPSLSTGQNDLVFAASTWEKDNVTDGHKLYVGKDLITSGTGGTSFITTNSTYGSIVGDASAGGTNTSFRPLIVLFYNRVLTAAELLLLYADPFQVVRSRQQIQLMAASTASYVLQVSAGAFTMSGQSAALKASNKLVASAASYSISGQSIGLRCGRKLGLTVGAYTLAGSTTSLLSSQKLALTAGAYTLSGQNAGMLDGRKLSLTGGVYSFSGQSLTLHRAVPLGLSTGAYSLAGQNVQLTYSPAPTGVVLTLTQGVYSLVGSSAGIRQTRKLATAPGAYNLTGVMLNLRRARRLTHLSGGYSLTGATVTLGPSLPVQQASTLHDLERALRKGLADCALGLPLAEENASFDKPGGAPWASFELEISGSAVATLSQAGYDAYSGRIKLALNYPPTEGTGPTTAKELEVSSFFRAGRVLTYGATRVWVRSCRSSPGGQVGGFYRRELTITWDAFLDR